MIQPDDDQQANYQPTEHIEDVTTPDEDDESTPPDEDDLPPNEDGSDNTEDDGPPNNGYYSPINCDFPSSFFDDIAYNLSKDGSSDLELLVGKWDFIYYAYTEDGKTFSYAGGFPAPCSFDIREEVTLNSYFTNTWSWFFWGDAFIIAYCFSPTFNLISLYMSSTTFVMMDPILCEAVYGTNGIGTHLHNACSYVIKGDELIIYFTGAQRYNLLIFKRQKPPENVVPQYPNDDIFSPLNCNFPSSFVDDIAYNLSKDGSSDPALLVGIWYCINYAYTEDGKTISDAGVYPFPCYFEIKDEEILNSYSPNLSWTFGRTLKFRVDYCLSPSFNLIEMRAYSMSMIIPDWYDAVYGTNGIARNSFNACSYVIKGDELFIYFTGSERYNLLIFKKIYTWI